MSSIQKAVAEALNFGFQIEPDALKLLKKLADRRGMTGEVSDGSLGGIVRVVIDRKSKSQSNLTISVTDLRGAFPDVFDFTEVREGARDD